MGVFYVAGREGLLCGRALPFAKWQTLNSGFALWLAFIKLFVEPGGASPPPLRTTKKAPKRGILYGGGERLCKE